MQPILELFLEQLALLKDPSGPSYTDAFGLLERLTEIRGFMLVFDCPEPENIIVSLVSTCVSAARPGKNQETYNQLENLMAPLLTNILGEAPRHPVQSLKRKWLKINETQNDGLFICGRYIVPATGNKCARDFQHYPMTREDQNNLTWIPD